MPDEPIHASRDAPPRDPSKDTTGFQLASLPKQPPDNLPLELSSFIGREREIVEVKRLLGDTRLVTLTGPGGSGKTRLALALAQDLVEEFEDGAWWVELASLSDPELVPKAVASALGMREVPASSLTAALVENLKLKNMLLILDNCEHLLEGCAVLADSLLRTCPDLEIVSTSREALRISGETTWLVLGLSLPDQEDAPPVGELAGYEAIRLFVERAKAVDAGFALTERNASAVARLCQKLDGIPLAIELAAARVRMLSVEQISEQLENSLGLLTTGSRVAALRHQTLRATLEWSYELLNEAERTFYGRLSVFAGGCDLEAAETVGAGGSIKEGEVLDLLSSLVDKSLVVAEAGEEGVPRYRMLEPIRQYALERLMETGEADEARCRHAAFFVALAEEARPKLRAEPQVEWLQRLDRENANLRAALSWAFSADDIPTAARLGWALWQFWWTRNYQPEGERWMEPILARKSELPPRLRARAIIAYTAMAYGQGDSEVVERYSEELMELSREVGRDAHVEAYAHVGFGLVATLRGDFEAAPEHLEVALPLLRESGDDATAALTHISLGTTVLLLQGDQEGARQRFEEGLALSRSLGDRVSECIGLFNLAQLALAGGHYEASHSRFAEGISPSEELGDRGNIAYILEGLGIVAGARNEAGRAARLLGASEALISAIGLRDHTYYRSDPHLYEHIKRSLYERIEAKVRAAIGEAAFEAAKEEGRDMSPERAIEYALEERTTQGGGNPADGSAPAGLSKRELEVLRLVARGMSNQDIAANLVISEHTVHRHVANVLAKLGTSSRAAAVAQAAGHGLL
jgi:predicted ATPase/DNA-binding CsgD family transcriptional regulator